MKQFMVRVMRSYDEEYADVVVDAENRNNAIVKALDIVKANPDMWFDVPPPPSYYALDEDVEDVTGGEYASFKPRDQFVYNVPDQDSY